jgi:hypothetical protein
MAISLTIDLTQIEGFADAFKKSPKSLVRNINKAYRDIGRYDIKAIRENVGGHLKLVSQGAAKSFKEKSSDPNQAKDLNHVFTSEYTGWKAAAIFQTGGVIQGKGKMLTILTPQARRATGKRQFTQSQIRQMVADQTARFVPTPRGILLVQFTAKGKLKKKKGNYVILAILKRQVTEQKRINFYETSEGAESIHQEMIEYAIEDTLAEIASNEKAQGE